jgi:two-component system, OmpR family, alkaline phosphatase synthesis response regulator PhoP
MAKARILIVDDEEDILELLRYNLERDGYKVIEAHDGAEALAIAHREPPDLFVLDIMMPRMDGIETCRRIREHAGLRRLPVLMLTARSDESDHVKGLDVGADIYLTKPISIPLLLSQVRAMLRGTTRFDELPELIRIHDLEIDRQRYVVRRVGEEATFRLPRKEFELLRYLAANPGRVYSRQDLLDEVWGRDVYVVDRTVDVHVRKVREKIGEDYIETVKGVGYRFRE